MKKIIYVVIIILLSACRSEPTYQKILTNKTVKVYSKDYHDKAENYTFKWEPPLDPNNELIPFDLKNDMLIFSPITEGNYQIHLSIIDISDEVVADKIFYYMAVSETLEVAIIKPKPDNNILENTSRVNKTKEKSKSNLKTTKITQRSSKKQRNLVKSNKNINFTIQVAAWPSLEQARSDQLQLINEGIDSYIQRHYKDKNDEIWYRVRVGNFDNKNKAIEIQKKLEKITGKKSWLDIILKE